MNYTDIKISNIPRIKKINYDDIFNRKLNFSRLKDDILWKHGWNKDKQENSRRWINKLQYEGHVSYFFVYNLKWYEGIWSWMIIVISTITAALSLVQINNDKYEHINTGIKISLSIAAIITTLLAAWIKKENYMTRIQETDRYLQKIQKLTTECDHILSQDVEHRITYSNYIEEYQQSVINLLAATVPMSPEEYKKAVYNITKYYPESVQNLWPWYESKHLSGKIYYYEMTDFGNDVLKSYKQIKYHSFIYKILCFYYCQSKCCQRPIVSVFTDPVGYNKYEVNKKIKLLNYKDKIHSKLHHAIDIKNNTSFDFLNSKKKSYENKTNINTKKFKSRSTIHNLRPYCE
jgi:hypothetical protein